MNPFFPKWFKNSICYISILILFLAYSLLIFHLYFIYINPERKTTQIKEGIYLVVPILKWHLDESNEKKYLCKIALWNLMVLRKLELLKVQYLSVCILNIFGFLKGKSEIVSLSFVWSKILEINSSHKCVARSIKICVYIGGCWFLQGKATKWIGSDYISLK